MSKPVLRVVKAALDWYELRRQAEKHPSEGNKLAAWAAESALMDEVKVFKGRSCVDH